MKPLIVTVDAALPLDEEVYEPVVRKLPDEYLSRTFGDILDYVLKDEPDELNPQPLNLAERHLADRIEEYLEMGRRDPNIRIQIMVPNCDAGPFLLSQTVNGVVKPETRIESGMEYSYLELKVGLYEAGGFSAGKTI